MKNETISNKIIMSFCIPTFNRAEQLLELVNSFLSIDREDFDIVITDNCSTDDTQKRLSKIDDVRLKILINKEPLPALNNMIQAIFNGDGKYIFYCNDREIIYPEKIRALIKFLENKEFTFIYVKNANAQVTNSYEIYKDPYESLIHHDCTHHPSGMVFNGELLREKLHKEKYFSYLESLYTYSYLMRDLLQYGTSAIYDFGCWKIRPDTFLKKSKSGTKVGKKVHFFPEISYINAKNVFHQVFKENNYSLDQRQKNAIALHIGNFFVPELIRYKISMMSYSLTAHYQLETKFIPWLKMHLIMKKYCTEIENLMIQYHMDKSAINTWKKNRKAIYINTLKSSLVHDTLRYILRKKW